MRKTANYDLCQWDAEDRILREDFNRDNAILDKTLAGLSAADHLDMLVDVTTQESCDQLEIDLSDVDLTQYHKLIIRPELRTYSQRMAHLRLNGLTGIIYGKWNYLGTIGTTNHAGPGMGEYELILTTPIIGRYLSSTQDINSTTQSANEGLIAVAPASVTPATLTRLTLFADEGEALESGSRVCLLGVRL